MPEMPEAEGAMQKTFVIAIDQSTQSTKAMLFDRDSRLVAREDIAHRQIVNEMGWVEHDPAEIAANVLTVLKRLIRNSGVDPRAISCIGVANQRETVAVWDRKTGKPVYNAIVWQCNRASSFCARLEREGRADYIRKTTGLILSPFFSAPKISWIFQNVKGALERARRGELCCGTMDSWVIYNLTGGKVHKTDVSNASRTMLLSLEKLRWDEKACELFGIPMACLPEICDSDALYGYTDLDGMLENPIPIHAAIGDSHAVLFAQGCLEKGMCMTGFGTGSCVMMNIGDIPLLSNHGVLSSVAWKTACGLRYAFDGVINYSGAVVTWLCKDLGLAASPAETDSLAQGANPADRSYLVPAFTGIGAPHWKNEAKAVLCGMSRTTGRAEIVRAGLESIAYQVADVVRAMTADSGVDVPAMTVAGGPTKNHYLMQFQSDILGCPVRIPHNEERTCLGAALIAGMATGVFDKKSCEDLAEWNEYRPAMAEALRAEKIAGWNKAIGMALGIEVPEISKSNEAEHKE